MFLTLENFRSTRETLNVNDIQEPPQSDSNFSISCEPHENKERI